LSGEKLGLGEKCTSKQTKEVTKTGGGDIKKPERKKIEKKGIFPNDGEQNH